MTLKTPPFSLFSNLAAKEKSLKKTAKLKASAASGVSEKKRPSPEKATPQNSEPITRPIEKTSSDLPQAKPIASTKAPTKLPEKPKSMDNISPPRPKKPPERSFASMEKLMESIDPNLNVYKEDVVIKRKKVFFGFPRGLDPQEERGRFYTKLQTAIEGHLADVEQVDEQKMAKESKAQDKAALFEEASVILLAHESFDNSFFKEDAAFNEKSLDKKDGYSFSTFKGTSVVILEPIEAYNDASLKKSLWSYLQELLHGS